MSTESSENTRSNPAGTTSANPVHPPVPSSVQAQQPLPSNKPAHWWTSITKQLRKPLPGAQPRMRFEPPAEEEPTTEDSGQPIQSPARTRSEGRHQQFVFAHPIYFGFMATLGVGIALGLYFVAVSTNQLLLWILTALFIALGLDPVVRWLEARKIPRAAGILITLAVLVSAVVGFFATLIPTIVSQTTQLVTKAPGWVNDFLNSDFFKNVDSQFHVRDRISEEVAKFFGNSQAVGGVAGGVLGLGSSIVNGLFGALIVLVLSLYFLASLPNIKRWGYLLAPRSNRKKVEALSEEITTSVGNYVIGQVCVALINAVYAFIVMSIVGVPFSILLAFVVALLAFIPLVGGMIAGILVSLVALSAGWQTALVYAVLYFAYLQFEAYFVSPRIMQKAVAVPGAVAVISVIAGGSLLGVLGALVAIPTAAAVMLLIRELFLTRQNRL
ncbi:AI-2E family transporter [Psychromicrobium xiongbiense]|uniref:AI-2E family transporter n=1 Tax=Psychromicrobium xiongbiense TaxID=3051184 RepID=UPI002554109E|nr:AI-2E family transporter [Psychromicrobium sp. YIM S02556]